MIAMLLGWTRLPQWALELIVIASVAGGIWYWQHQRYEAGIHAQQTADAIDTERLREDAMRQSAILQTRASSAEQAYETELKANVDYQRQHPVEPMRLCLPAAARRGGVPETGARVLGNADAGTAGRGVRPVPAGNPERGGGNAGPDISGMLETLAMKCDSVSAVLREFQER